MMNKTRLLYIVIAVLVLINGVTLAVMFTHNRHGGKHGPPAHEWLAKQLNFSTTQQQQYHTLLEQHRTGMETIHKQDRDLHDRFFKLLQGAATDSVTVQQLADSIAQNRVQTELQTFYNFKQIRAICTPQQQQKFDEVVKDVLRMMAPPQHRPHR